ncbi:MAG TPA: four helix bundle protein [Pseudomonadales bacterium]|nr:four helix bundle protein [Pseudomonadales bacterium]
MTGESRIQNPGARIKTDQRTPAKNFQQLIVWQKAHQFTLGVYQLTESFPRKEVFGLTAQLRRAAISIPANIAEGFKKRGRADKGRYLNIAQGSLEECRYFLILAKDLHYGDISQLNLQLEEVSKLLEAYSAKILTSGF